MERCDEKLQFNAISSNLKPALTFFFSSVLLCVCVFSVVSNNDTSVATDYVPKISKPLLGPSRIVIAGMTGVMFLGLSFVSISSKGGIKGCLKGLWNPSISEKE